MDRQGYQQLDRIEVKLDLLLKKLAPELIEGNTIKELGEKE